MRKLTFMPIAAVAALGAVFAMQSCGKIASKLHYDLPLQTGSVEVTIPPTSDTTNQLLVGSGVNHYNIDSFIKANTGNVLGINNITSVKVTSVTLTLTANASTTNNFANFKSAYASFFTDTKTTPYEVSIPNNPDTYADMLSLPVTNDELKDYLKGSTYNYTVGGKLRRPITDSVKCKVEFKFNVTVNG
jgi:hypothetical protein